MAKLSSELSIRDGFSKMLNKFEKSVNNTIDIMQQAESMSSSTDLSMPKVATSAQNAAKQVKKVSDEVSNLDGKSVNNISSGFGGLSKAIIVANQSLDLITKAYQGLSRFMNEADTRTSVDARLNLVVDSSHTKDQLEQQVMSMANLTRSKYEDTADLVAKIGRQDIFKGQNDKAVKFAENINKSFIVSGASVAEMSGSIRQLTQALASGVLRGDEFNSVMENAPVLAEMIANRLGITKGEMRDLAAEGKLTAETVANAVLASTSEIDKQFNQMPMTFGQGMTVIQNKISDVFNQLSQTGQPINQIIIKVQELIAWLETIDGQNFMAGLASAIGFVINLLIQVSTIIGDIYKFFSTNWTMLEPIIVGIATAVGLAVTALTAYKIIAGIITGIQGVLAAATVILTGAKWAEAAAQWGLNAAMYANPIVWIIALIVIIIGIIIALTVWIINLWKTNIDFRVGVIRIWNSILGFFDNVGLFFMTVGYAIADAFSYAKVTSLNILQALANGAIDIVNGIIKAINLIPGVNIGLIDKLTFAADTALQEEAKRQARAADLADARQNVANKASDRESKLQADEAKWRAEADKKEQETKKQDDNNSKFKTDDKVDNVYVTGGGLDEKIDLSNQTLQYLKDIAEEQALSQFDALNSFMYIVNDDSQSTLSEADKSLLLSQSGAKSSVYYLQYQGGVNLKTEVKQGDDWETIKQKAMQETQTEIDIGLSDLDKVVCR